MSVKLDDKYIKELDFDLINKNIELNLILISKYPRNSFLNTLIQLTSENELPSNPKKSIIDFMKIEQLIDAPNEHMLNLTKFGYEVVRKGGWIKHLERERIKTKLSDRKERYDFNLSKWKHNTFVPLFLVAIFGGLYSGYDFIYNLSSLKEQQLQEQRLQHMEAELTKLHISISVQKNLDSLRNSTELTKKIDK